MAELGMQHKSDGAAGTSTLELLARLSDIRTVETGVDMTFLATEIRPQIDAMYMSGAIDKAIILEKSYLTAAVGAWGEDDTRTIQSLSNLSSALGNTGRPDSSLILLHKVIQLRTKNQGANHPDTLTACAYEVAAYLKTGQTSKAKDLGEQLLSRCQRHLTSEHEATLRATTNLAYIYCNTGQMTKGAELLSKAYEIESKVLPWNDLHLITTMVSLSTVYHRIGKTEAAADLASQALDRRRKLYGDKHDSTQRLADQVLAICGTKMMDCAVPAVECILNNLRETDGADSVKYASTEEMYVGMMRALAIEIASCVSPRDESRIDRLIERLIGGVDMELTDSNKLDYLLVVRGVGEQFAKAKNWNRAKTVLGPVVTSLDETRGRDNTDTLYAMQMLAFVCSKLDLPDHLEWLQIMIADGQRSSRGEGSKQYQSAISSLVSTYSADGRWAEAEQLALHLIDLRQQSGSSQEDVLIALWRLQEIYNNSHQWKKLEPVARESLELAEKTFGVDDLRVIGVRANFAQALSGRGKHDEAIVIQKEVIRIELDTDAPLDTLGGSRINLGKMYLEKGLTDNAVEQLTLAAENLLEASEEDDTKTTIALMGLGKLLAGRGASNEDLDSESLSPIQEMALGMYKGQEDRFKTVPSDYFGVDTDDVNWRTGVQTTQDAQMRLLVQQSQLMRLHP